MTTQSVEYQNSYNATGGRYECSHCDTTVDTRAAIKEHLEDDHRWQQCFCGYQTFSLESLADHHDEEHGF